MNYLNYPENKIIYSPHAISHLDYLWLRKISSEKQLISQKKYLPFTENIPSYHRTIKEGVEKYHEIILKIMAMIYHNGSTKNIYFYQTLTFSQNISFFFEQLKFHPISEQDVLTHIKGFCYPNFFFPIRFSFVYSRAKTKRTPYYQANFQRPLYLKECDEVFVRIKDSILRQHSLTEIIAKAREHHFEKLQIKVVRLGSPHKEIENALPGYYLLNWRYIPNNKNFSSIYIQNIIYQSESHIKLISHLGNGIYYL